jgi:hypothetical protein
MPIRPRAVLGVIATVALFALALFSAATSSAGTPGDGAAHRAAIVAKAGLTRAGIAERAVRHTSPPMALAGVGVALATVAAIFAPAGGLIGGHRRRIGDAGEDWRSLLHGAPPALA